MSTSKEFAKITPNYGPYRSPSLLQSMVSTGVSPSAGAAAVNNQSVPHFQCFASPQKAGAAPLGSSRIREEDWKKFRMSILAPAASTVFLSPPGATAARTAKEQKAKKSEESNYDSNSSESDYEETEKKPVGLSTFCPETLANGSTNAPANTVPANSAFMIVGPSIPFPIHRVIPAIGNNFANERAGSMLVIPNQKTLKKSCRRVSSFLDQGATFLTPVVTGSTQLASIEECKAVKPASTFGRPKINSKDLDKKMPSEKPAQIPGATSARFKNDRTVLKAVYGKQKPLIGTGPKRLMVKKMLIKKATAELPSQALKPPSTPPRRRSEFFNVVPEAPHKVLADDSRDSDVSMERAQGTGIGW